MPLRKALTVLFRFVLKEGDPFPFFQPQHTADDWHLAGRLFYDFGGFPWTDALLFAQRRVAELLPLSSFEPQCELRTLRTAFLAGFVARFLEVWRVPPRYCPLEFPAGVFLQEVPLVPGTPSPQSSTLSEAADRAAVALPTRQGWLLCLSRQSPQRYVVCSPPPAPEAVRVDLAVLDRPYPWW
uniref:Uncharacterized protein n=1 Tax=Thermogemmatispora argillosa TaxID=2045280 RepID=A0A455SY15_9CHLR|nr:hypothetical protein KTA_02600 [Thermogemmatispora argillosa]